MASILIYRNVILAKSNSKCLIGLNYQLNSYQSLNLRTLLSKYANNLQIRLQSNQTNNSQSIYQTVIKTGSTISNENEKTPFEKLDLTFTNTKEAYKSKKMSDLIRACLVLKLSSFDYLVQNHEKVISNV